MLPLTLVTGFLGAGKTTLLSRLAKEQKGRALVFLVNEFSPGDVDGAVVEAEGVDAIAIPGGSIFCKCLVSEFIKHLSDIPRLFPDTTGVVIEASGIADPRVISTMLKETKLDSVYNLARVITVVDPNSFPKLIQTLPNIRSQVESADTVLVNKVDLFSEEEVSKTVELVYECNKDVDILKTNFCAIEFDVFGERCRQETEGEYALCADPNYIVRSIVARGKFDLEKLREAIEEVADSVYRLKGFVLTDKGVVKVDFSSGQWCDVVVSGFEEKTGLSVIVAGDKRAVADELSSRIVAGSFCK